MAHFAWSVVDVALACGVIRRGCSVMRYHGEIAVISDVAGPLVRSVLLDEVRRRLGGKFGCSGTIWLVGSGFAGITGNAIGGVP